MADHDDLTWRVQENVVQRLAGRGSPELLADGGAEHDRMCSMLDGFVDDRRAGRASLQQLGPDSALPSRYAGAGGRFGLKENLFTARDLPWQLGVERHGLQDFDDVDDRDIHVLVGGNLLNDFQQSPVAFPSADGNDQSMNG